MHQSRVSSLRSKVRSQAEAAVKTNLRSHPFMFMTSAHFIVEALAAMVYLPGMSQTLEKRVERLEHKLAELTSGFAARKPRKKDWRRTFGLSRGDDGFKEMMSLG